MTIATSRSRREIGGTNPGSRAAMGGLGAALWGRCCYRTKHHLPSSCGDGLHGDRGIKPRPKRQSKRCRLSVPLNAIAVHQNCTITRDSFSANVSSCTGRKEDWQIASSSLEPDKEQRTCIVCVAVEGRPVIELGVLCNGLQSGCSCNPGLQNIHITQLLNAQAVILRFKYQRCVAVWGTARAAKSAEKGGFIKW